MMKKILFGLILVFLSLNIEGCATDTGSVKSAFDNITFNSSQVDGNLMDYKSVISLNGMMPLQLPGMFFEDPAGDTFPFGNKNASSPSLMIGISPKQSFRVVQTFQPVKECKSTKNGNVSCVRVAPTDIVTKIRDAYLEVRPLAVKKVALQIKLALARNVQNNPKDMQAAALAAKVLDFKLTKQGTVDQNDLNKLPNTIRQLKIDSTTNDKKLEKRTEALVTLSGASNVIITRWAKDNKTGGSVNVPKFGGASGSYASNESGILILAGIRTISLDPGEDFLRMLRSKSNPIMHNYFDKIGTVTYVLQAQALASISELDAQQTLQMHFHLSENTFKKVLALTNVSADVDAYIASATNLFSSSVMSRPETQYLSYCFAPASLQRSYVVNDSDTEGCEPLGRKNKYFMEDSLPAKLDVNGYITVFSVKASLKDSVISAIDKMGK